MKRGKISRIYLFAAIVSLTLSGCAKGPDTSPETNFVYEKSAESKDISESTGTVFQEETSNETLPEEERLIALRNSLYPMEEGAANKGLKVTLQGAYAYDQLSEVEEYFTDPDFISYFQRYGSLDSDGNAVGDGCFLILDVILQNQNTVETEFDLHQIMMVNLDMESDWIYREGNIELEGMDQYQNDKMSKDAYKFTLDTKEETEVRLMYFLSDRDMTGVRDGSHQLAVSICNENIRITSENAGEYTGDGIVYLLIDWNKVEKERETGEAL